MVLGLWSWVLGLWFSLGWSQYHFAVAGGTDSIQDKDQKPKSKPYSSYLLNNNAAFVPPNPNEFESTYSTSAGRGSLGT